MHREGKLFVFPTDSFVGSRFFTSMILGFRSAPLHPRLYAIATLRGLNPYSSPTCSDFPTNFVQLLLAGE